jgi:CelD/BcsL family acetyltransferase involved in cellulose biosynthesis
MTPQIILGEIIFDQLSGEWDALASRGMTDTPFQRLAYQRAWWTHLQPPNSTLSTVAVRDGGGELMAIGCFYNVGGALYFNGCVEETDYLDLVSPPESAAEAWLHVIQCLSSVESRVWDQFILCNIPESSPTRTILAELSGRLGVSLHEELIEVCPIINLPASFDAYLESLDSKQRREVSRKLRRAEAAGMQTRVINQEDDLDKAIGIFLDLLQKSTFEKREWLHEGRRAVFQEVARSAHDAGMLQLMITELEERPAAALFNFDYKDRIWVYNSGLDPALFASLSPGVVLTATAIEQAILQGRKEFDFLRGSEEYKYRFGAEDTHIYRITLGRPGL